MKIKKIMNNKWSLVLMNVPTEVISIQHLVIKNIITILLDEDIRANELMTKIFHFGFHT